MTADRVAATVEAVTEPAVLEWWDSGLASTDPLSFDGYVPPPHEEESVRTALVTIAGRAAVWIDCDFRRYGGTMGAVAGERIVHAFRRATELRLPVVETVSSGGARLQEGMISLVQMARTASAVARHSEAGLISAAYLSSPTTGGVFASWASLSDVRAAEPEATVGFGGPRVVVEVTGSPPPAGSHTAESALLHGLVDAIVPRADRWAWLAAAIGASPAAPLTLPPGRATGPDATPVPSGAWDVLRRCRASSRASGLEWAAWLVEDWVELRGADPAMRAGLATLIGQRIVVVALDRFAGVGPLGLPGPGAFRLAQRAIRLASRLGLPVLTIVDTPGADPSAASESDGIGGEIARTLLAMAECRSPSVCLTVGEGGSGGAMALAHADRLLILQGAVFSVIGPRAGAAILYRDGAREPQLTESLRVTAADLSALGVVDQVLPEDLPVVRSAVAEALTAARVGDRDRRTDELTARSMAAKPTHPTDRRKP